MTTRRRSDDLERRPRAVATLEEIGATTEEE